MKSKHGGSKFGVTVQEKCMEKGLVIIGMSGGADLQGKSGDHLILAPAYNVTSEEVTKIVDLLVNAVEEVLY